MKIKHQLSIATLLMAGVFVTGCSQQSAGGSQVSGGSQASGGSQVSGSSQTQNEGASQVSGSQQQVEGAAPVVAEPVPAPAKPMKPVMAPKQMPRKPMAPVRRANPWTHYHPEAPKCAKTKRHTHKYLKNGVPHHHRYACQKPRMMHKPMNMKPKVDVYALQRKLKAKGYYKGPIDGIVGPGTRSALQRFMKR